MLLAILEVGKLTSKSRFFFAVFLALFSLVLSACGSGDESSIPIVASNDKATTVEGKAVWIDALVNDSGRNIQIREASWPSHGTLTILSDKKGISYQPDEGYIGADRFTYTIEGGNNATDTANIDINVIAANSIELTAANDSAKSSVIQALIDVLANDSGEGIKIESITSPSNGTATLEDTEIRYRKNPDFHGVDNFSYTVVDDNGAHKTASVVVFMTGANSPPEVSDDYITVRELSKPTPVEKNVLENDYVPPNHDERMNIVAVTQPAHGSATILSTSRVSYLPTPGFFGIDTFNYVVTDSYGLTATATVHVNVIPNSPPVANDDTLTVTEGLTKVKNVVFNDTDADGDQLTITAVTQPDHGTVTILSDMTTVSYASDTGYAGTDTFTYTISDGNGGTDTATVTVNVEARTYNPVAVDDAAVALVGHEVYIPVLHNDYDPDNVDDITLVTATQPSHGTVTRYSTVIGYTSDSGFIGTDTFTYTIIDDDGFTDTATVTVNVKATNTPPVGVNDSYTIPENTSLFLDVLANDNDPDGDPLDVYNIIGAHATGENNGIRNGIRYTPPVGFIGTDSFTYQAYDLIDTSNTVTVTITVTAAANTPPVATDDTATTVSGASVVVDVLANDTDSDGDSLSITTISDPANGTATLNPTGGIRYIPVIPFTGNDTFTYSVSDGHGGTDTATVTVTVVANSNPVAVDDVATTVASADVTIDVLANDTDADGQPLGIVTNLVSQPTHGNVLATTTDITYSPDYGFTGTDTFTYTITDYHGGTDTATVTVTVNHPPVIRVSVDSSGNQAVGSDFLPTGSPAISADGRYVAFRSAASNLVANDTNGQEDVFLRDTANGATTLISVGHDVPQANGDSRDPAISADGRYVAFRSAANNLVTSDGNAADDIFLRDTQTDTTTIISLDTGGGWSNGASYDPDISADGRYVVFYSAASDLVSGDTNGVLDVFLRDTQTNTTTRISVASDGTQANGNSLNPAISADGRYVVFQSDATNLVTGDTNGKSDIFLHDTQTGTTTRVSVDSSGTEGNNPSHNPAISADGRYIAFDSAASNLVSGDTNVAYDIFLHDTQTGNTSRVSVTSAGSQSTAYENSNSPAISDDGRYVTFFSNASNLVSGDSNVASDIFVHDTQTGATTRVSVAAASTQASGASVFPEISADGQYVVYYSAADNLVNGDTNGLDDAFRVDLSALP
jgi:Tol biopolymer transport system component